MRTKLLILSVMGVFTLLMYIFKDFFLTYVPDNNYSDEVVRNKTIFIAVLAVVGFVALYLTNRYVRRKRK